MKFIITESQKERAIFKYLDLLGLKQINTEDNVYFVKSEEDGYAQIKYQKNNGFCYNYFGLVNEISFFFSLSNDDVKDIIGAWVEDKLQMKVVTTLLPQKYWAVKLKIPNK